MKPETDVEHLLAEQRYVRSLARILVADPDEVEQQTWLHAIEHGGQGVSQPRQWLARIARNVAADLRRADRRRRASEQTRDDLDAEEPAMPSAAEVAEREEARRVLLAEVERLSEGARTAIWLRYFEELQPREIAARLGIPVATVWTQLRRGLAALRERLGRDRDRRLLLAPLLTSVVPRGLGAAPAGGASSSVWGSALHAVTKPGPGVFAVVALALITALVGWWVAVPSVEGEPDLRTAASPVPEKPVVAESIADPVAGSVAGSGERAPSESVGSPFAAATGVAVLRGRCVDSEGNPVAGVFAELEGWPANQRRVNWYLQNDGQPIDWTNPEPVTTGADGRFAFSFEPPRPYQFRLELVHPSLLPVSGHWLEIEPGAVLDLGDVRLGSGPRVRGVLVDREGRRVLPGRKSSISLSRRRPEPSGEGPLRGWLRVHTPLDDDGCFEFPCAVAAGEWRVATSPWLALAGKEWVSIAGDSVELRVVVDPQDAAQRAARPASASPEIVARALCGTVTDRSGNPVRGALVRTRAAPIHSARTDAIGRFRLVGGVATRRGDKTRLRVTAPGFVEHAPEPEFEWGSEHLRFRLTSKPTLVVRVVRAETARPVGRFGVRLEALSGKASKGDRERVHGGWDHPGGVAKIAGLESGEYRVWVQPVRSTGLLEARGVVRLMDGVSTELPVRLPAPIRQPVIVRLPNGEPAVGSTVELVDAMGEQVTIASGVRRHDRRDVAPRGTLLDEATTDARGVGVVAGPSRQPLVLRVLGDHAPLVTRIASLSTRPIERTVARGVTVRVRAEPASVLADWERVRATWPRAGSALSSRAPRPAVRLSPNGSRLDTWPPAASDAVAFDSSGVATVRNVPAGRWDVRILYPTSYRMGKSRTFRQGVELREGRDVEVVVDLLPYRTGRLEANLLAKGRLGRSMLLFRRSVRIAGSGGRPEEEALPVVVREDGHVVTSLSVGTWSVSFDGVVHGRRQRIGLPPVTIAPGAVLRTTFRIEGTVAELTLIDPGGQPAAGAALVARSAEHPDVELLAVADGAGRVALRGAPGTYRVRARIRSLSTAIQWGDHIGALHDRFGGDELGFEAARARALVDVGTVTLPARGVAIATLRLPGAWDR